MPVLLSKSHWLLKTAHGRVQAAVVEDVTDGVTRIGGRAFKTQAITGWNFSGYPGPQVHVLALSGSGFCIAEEKPPFQVLVLVGIERSVREQLREAGRLPFASRNRSAVTMATSEPLLVDRAAKRLSSTKALVPSTLSPPRLKVVD